VADSREQTAQRVLREGPQFLLEAMTPKLFAPETLRTQPKLVTALQQVILKTDPRGIAGASRGMAVRPDMTARLGEIACPALVLCGAEDAISPPTEMRGIARAMPRARFVEIPAAGHMAPYEQPAAVSRAIQQFLEVLA
jgi:pimeloyl-ACP methyl ester carboxylesterase